MATKPPEIVVAGHICLDIIPSFAPARGSLSDVLVPGKLVDVGPAVTATGGAVSNTGLVLHRLGIGASLMGKVGDDCLGATILEILRRQGAGLAGGMIVAPGEPSSYSVVISMPGIDRVFLHCPGANDTFGAEDVRVAALAGAGIFHFGYPPLMKKMYCDGGEECAELFRRVRASGVATSLDLAKPDPATAAGKANWQAILAKVLPNVDVFLPSIDEILFMLDRPRFDELSRNEAGSFCAGLDGPLLADIAGRLLDMGAAIVGIKLGDHGFYLRCTGDRGRLREVKALALTEAWLGCEEYGPCFRANLIGTTGSGDATIAGFLLGLVRGMAPWESVQAALAVGACSVEAPDATSGVGLWRQIAKRLDAGWDRLDLRIRPW